MENDNGTTMVTSIGEVKHVHHSANKIKTNPIYRLRPNTAHIFLHYIRPLSCNVRKHWFGPNKRNNHTPVGSPCLVLHKRWHSSSSYSYSLLSLFLFGVFATLLAQCFLCHLIEWADPTHTPACLCVCVCVCMHWLCSVCTYAMCQPVWIYMGERVHDGGHLFSFHQRSTWEYISAFFDHRYYCVYFFCVEITYLCMSLQPMHILSNVKAQQKIKEYQRADDTRWLW